MQHKDVKKGNIHAIHNFEFTSKAERDSYIPSAEDINKVCLVLEPYCFYSLKSIEPIIWDILGKIEIRLEDYDVYSKEETLALLSAKSNSYNMSATEFSCGYTRGGKEVFGIEVDCGALPNNTQKIITIPNYNALYIYWIDTTKSYGRNPLTKWCLPLPYANAGSLSASVQVELTDTGKIIINTLTNRSTHTETKIVLNYTKG